MGFASGDTGQYFAALARRRAIGCIFAAGRKRHSGPQFLNKGVFMELRLRDAIACFLFLLIVTAAKGQAATVIYAATQNGPYKSADGGLTWKPITVNSGNSFLQGVPNLGAIAVDPQNPSTVCFAGAFNGGTSGFCKSTDAAQSWSCVTLIGIRVGSSSGTTQIAIDPVFTNVIYLASTGYNVMRSTDGGITWSNAGVGVVADNVMNRSQMVWICVCHNRY